MIAEMGMGLVGVVFYVF